MYCPAHFAETRPDVLHALMRDHPLATLVTTGADGPNADHIPLLLETTADGTQVLYGHVARANPIWKTVREGTPALAVFHGPQAYITPSWYPSKREHGKAVPTWNYAVVHARGPLRFVEDTDWLRRHVQALTRMMESGFAEPWAVSDAPADYIENMLAATVGLELVIASLAGKWKASQNQPDANRSGAALGLRQLGHTDAAKLIERSE
jgi:transcriptional regulator